MKIGKFRHRAFLGLMVLGLLGSETIAVQLSKNDGDRLQRKLDEITKNAAAPQIEPKKTPVSETEVNSYLNLNIKDKIPQGLTHPEITILGNGSLAGRVLLDLDEFNRRRSPQGLVDPLAYLSGKLPVTARGVLRTRDGKGQFQLGSAEIHGFNLPKPIVQELVTFFSRTPENPRGFNLDAPFELPAKIREIAVDKGEAVFVQ